MVIKNVLKKINRSLGRFISLVLIIMLGVGFYAGIRQSTPAIRDVQNRYVVRTNMMDLQVVSTLGFNENDIKALEKLEDVEYVTGGYSGFVYSEDDVIRILSIDKLINKYQLRAGRAPQKDNECLADYKHYKVGDYIRVKEPKDKYLKTRGYKVTGTISTPLYLGKDLGNADIGNGELKSFILVRPEVFDLDVYTEMYVTMKKTDSDIPYSESYEKKLDNLQKEIKSVQKDREKKREEELFEEAKNTAYQEIEENKTEIKKEVREELEKRIREEAEKQREKKKRELEEQAAKFGKTLQQLIVSMGEKANELMNPISEAKIQKAVEEQLPDAVDKAIKEAKEEAVNRIKIPECKWYVQTRNDVVAAYKALVDQYKEVETIADVIPIFFIVIVFLMTMNTMSRMIAEERGEMGTFSSLGISNAGIIFGYMVYVLIATIVGVVGGYFIGVLTLPGFVYACFPLALPDISFSFDVTLFAGSIIVSFVVMTLVTVISCMKELRSKPAYLLRPVPPKKARSILLEKVGFIWNHLSFSWKVTIRNISRYKRRVLMTIIGVGGCTFLMLIGFAIRDCISTVGDKQFDDILHYDVMAVLGKEARSFESIPLKENEISRDELGRLLEEPLMIRQDSMKVENQENYSLDVFLISVDTSEEPYRERFEKYFTLRQADPRDVKSKSSGADEIPMGEELKLSDDGVIITPRIADVMKVNAGDEMTIKDLDGEEYKVKVEGVAENYVSNYIYMTKALNKKVFNKDYYSNAVVAKTGVKGSTLSKKLYDIDSFVSVNTTEKILKKANEAVEGLDSIVMLLIVIASMLAFTVLYNLTAINISERTREIATFKVLGFFPGETNNMFYRETIISSLIGIIAGIAVSPYLHGKVMDLLEVDNLVFLREVKTSSYLISAGLALLFSLIMMVVSYIRLNKIDMIESLKSVD